MNVAVCTTCIISSLKGLKSTTHLQQHIANFIQDLQMWWNVETSEDASESEEGREWIISSSSHQID